ncbi:zinc transporter ZIP1-like [Hoplias malabaricus]|uniref:zinc transporter ZIP1-like n=1 Tax=Hoplias malabaricus TaxID=27720 RepID=UPI0034623E9C
MQVSVTVTMSASIKMTPAQLPPSDSLGLDQEVGSVILFFSSTLLFAFTPLWLLKGTGRCGIYSESRNRTLDLLGCCTAGVFLANFSLNMVPSYLAEMTETFSGLGVTLRFPVPEFILAIGFLLLLIIEQVILALGEQSGNHTPEKKALLVGSCVQPHLWPQGCRGKGSGVHAEVSPLSTVRVFVLVFSLSLCSVFEGLAVGLQEASGQGLDFHLALLLHKGLTAFSVAVRLTQNQLRRAAVTACLLFFSATCPLGVVLGISFKHSHTLPQYQLACSTLQGLAAGAFIYVILMEVLPHALSSSGQRISKITLLLTGFTTVTVLLLTKI